METPGPWHLRRTLRDGVLVWKLRCPRCRVWADLDEDQFHGRVSIECMTPGCDFHETADLSAFEE